jgi:hypothetical protein
MFLRDKTNWKLQWILLYLQESYLNDENVRYEAVAEQFRFGCRSRIMYLEAYQILKQNPNTLELLFTEYYVLNPVFKGVWFDIWKHREEVTRINPHKAVDTMRHMANKEYHHMKKNGFNHKKLATMFRLEKAIGDYMLGCKYKYMLQTDQAEFFLKVKRGNFVDSDEEGMRFIENCYEDINRLADRYLEHVPDVEDAEARGKLMRGLTDLVCMHLGYEIEVRE